MGARERRDAPEPDIFPRRVIVGHDQRHFDPLVEQDAEAATTDVVVREYDGSRHSFFSRIA
jgi:hypothetical protein